MLNETTRTSLLRHVLFEPSPVYGGLTLFQKFGEEAQDEIRVALDHLVYVLDEAKGLLEKHCRQPTSPESLTPTGSTLDLPPRKNSPSARTPSPESQWKSFPRTSIMLLRWSFHDKKRAEDTLQHFTALNGDIHEKTKLQCLASDLGLNLQHSIQHLQRLQSDQSSIRLGFHIDATLKLSAGNQVEPVSLELDGSWNETLQITPPLRGGFGLIEHAGRKYLLEHRPIQGEQVSASDLDARTKLQMEGLARLLHQPKELVFCMPNCIGWKKLPSTQQIGFVFDVPDGVFPKPTSLFRILASNDVRLSLGDRFRLAFALARCISRLQMVEWVHESFRSENILFFPQPQQRKNPENPCDYGKPLVLGFEPSRPEGDFSSGFADTCLERDVYRHPERQGRPGRRFCKIHDIYALGKKSSLSIFAITHSAQGSCSLRSACGSVPSTSKRIASKLLETRMPSKPS